MASSIHRHRAPIPLGKMTNRRCKARLANILKVFILMDVMLLCTALVPVPRSSISNNIFTPSKATATTSRIFTKIGGDGDETDSTPIERGGSSLPSEPVSMIQTIQRQYHLRVDADPNFLSKSITEVFLAAATQLTAEVNRRGFNGLMIEIDFVVAGLLTAIAGKYYSMWKTAPTGKVTGTDKGSESESGQTKVEVPSSTTKIPTNAFQTDHPYSILQRAMSFFVPIPSLFQAGFIASAMGYGLTAFLIFLRSTFVPNYVAATVNVNILHACFYTGGFMAIVSNIRYQLLQGVVEPHLIERFFRRFPVVKAALIFLVRLANGLLGSTLAIAGMKLFGLQKLK